MRKLIFTAMLALACSASLNAADAGGIKAPTRARMVAKQLTAEEERIARQIITADKAAKKAKTAAQKAKAAQKALKAQEAAMRARIRAAKATERAELAAARAANAVKASEEFTSCVDECVGERDEDECSDICLSSVE